MRQILEERHNSRKKDEQSGLCHIPMGLFIHACHAEIDPVVRDLPFGTLGIQEPVLQTGSISD
jgi:hypothetical protein